MTVFTEHTIESAPPESRRTMTAVRNHLGFLPSATARWAASPELLDGFGALNGLFESCSLDLAAREVVVMTVAVRNGCHLCVAMHTARLVSQGADKGVVEALRAGTTLPDPRLEAVRSFAVRLLDTAGDVEDEAVAAFLDAGYTPRNALEVVLGIGTYTMSTLANRLTRAPVDEPLRGFAA